MTPPDPATCSRDDRPPAWIRAILAGDADALSRWYRAEHPAVWRLCLGFLAERSEADDAAQDAMLHLLDTLARFDPRRPWPQWRNAIVLNLCRDRQRRRAARERAETAVAQTALAGLLDDPAVTASRAEFGDLIARSLARLSPREREAFVLHDLEGGTTCEVAAALSIAESTVRVLLATARRRLRDLLAKHLARDAAGETHA